jgi:hypothetical protein
MPPRSPLVLGLSESGLRKLGLDQQALATFPTAFQDGMAAPWRSRALGDIGNNDPNGWSWGGPQNRADAILNLYASSRDILQQEADRRITQLRRFRIGVIHEILLDEIPPRDAPSWRRHWFRCKAPGSPMTIREPFGFTDGISQPIVRGARRWVIQRNQIHVVEPGEMILGYSANFGHNPPVPSVAGSDLLGRNGTYFHVCEREHRTAVRIHRANLHAGLEPSRARERGRSVRSSQRVERRAEPSPRRTDRSASGASPRSSPCGTAAISSCPVGTLSAS